MAGSTISVAAAREGTSVSVGAKSLLSTTGAGVGLPPHAAICERQKMPTAMTTAIWLYTAFIGNWPLFNGAWADVAKPMALAKALVGSADIVLSLQR